MGTGGYPCLRCILPLCTSPLPLPKSVVAFIECLGLPRRQEERGRRKKEEVCAAILSFSSLRVQSIATGLGKWGDHRAGKSIFFFGRGRGDVGRRVLGEP